MKIVLLLIMTATALLQAGCSSSAGVYAGPEGHRHGVGISGRAGRSGVGLGVDAR